LVALFGGSTANSAPQVVPDSFRKAGYVHSTRCVALAVTVIPQSALRLSVMTV
jgi:hypothetical protein